MWTSNRLAEIVERSQKGPYLKEKDYDLKLMRKTAELVRQYQLSFDPQVLIPSDDGMADCLFQAGLELFVDVGVYNLDTQRIILFTREEVQEVLDRAPSQVILGEGRDAVIMRNRKVEDTCLPIVSSGPTGTPCSEEYHEKILMSYAQEPILDCLGAGSVATIGGRPIIPGTPLELQGAKRDATVARQVLRRVGRPGMHINDVAVPLTVAGKMAACDPAMGLRPCDGFLVSQMVELKTNYDHLSRVEYLLGYGAAIIDLMCPLIGGLGGGAEGTAVVSVAAHLLGVLCYQATYHFMSHTHIKYTNNTDRLGLWIQSMVAQALARNTHILANNDIYCISGPCTEELLYEVAAGSLVGTVSGMHITGAGCTGGSKTDHYTGLEARLMGEVAHAATGMSRKEANGLLLKLVERYEATLESPKTGKPFHQVYDTVTVRPTEEWVEIYERVKRELKTLGLKV